MLLAGHRGLMRVVVLGGAGNFGARIVRALKDDPDIELLAAGRRAAPVPGAEAVRAVKVDLAASDFAQQLRLLAPGLVIHCVGPFQGQDYRVACAALACGAHYVDLSDGREFVAGFVAAMDAAARAAARVAIGGASTVPALSSAVLDQLCADLAHLESIRIVIAPGQRAPRGAATLQAVFSYLGRPVAVWHNGRWLRQWGWMDLRRVRMSFGSRWSALCDVPDLALLPQRYAPVQSVTFHAALEVGLQHGVLWAMAAWRRLGLPLPVERWARGLDRFAALFDPLSGEWGGMQVEVAGTTATGARVRRRWHLQAPALHGPEIPCLAAIELARQLALGALIPSGARACMGMLELAAFEPAFARWGIRTWVEEMAA